MTGLIVAIDTADLGRARSLAEAVRPHCAMLKLGLEFFCAHGPAGIASIGGSVFLDLKLHDIPATVAGALGAVLKMRPRFVTLHAAGGPAMMIAARERAEASGPDRPRLLAVTVLTSLSDSEPRLRGHVLERARLAMDAGMDGLVCAAHEVAALRDALGSGPIIVVPGIRQAGSPADDQARVATPAEAARAGADYIVVGRPITSAADPAAAAAAITAELW